MKKTFRLLSVVLAAAKDALSASGSKRKYNYSVTIADNN